MPASDLRERVAFEARDSVDDGAGNTVSGPWVVQFVRWARVLDMRGNEQMEDGKLRGVQSVTITIRGMGKITPITNDWRARHIKTGKVYNIRSISNTDERRKYFDITADEGVPT